MLSVALVRVLVVFSSRFVLQGDAQQRGAEGFALHLGGVRVDLLERDHHRGCHFGEMQQLVSDPALHQ